MKKNIVVLAFNNISPFHLSVPCIVFEERANLQAFNLNVCSAEPDHEGSFMTSAGFSIQTDKTIKDTKQADVIIVPSWRDINERPPLQMLNAIRDAYERGATIVGLCLGTFVLAEAGILDNHKATTHWIAATSFSQRYPKVTIVPDVLYVEANEGRLVTSAGTAAGLDCCIHLVRMWYGAEIANRIAKRIVTSPHRQGGQLQYTEQMINNTESHHLLSSLLDWVISHLNEHHSIDSLAKKSAMSRRTFTRKFKELTGSTANEWINYQRVIYAQRLLETTNQPIELIAQTSGFGNTVSLRKQFHNHYKISPNSYRMNFQQKNK